MSAAPVRRLATLLEKGSSYARHRDLGVHRLQAPELQHDEEQEEKHGAAGVQQVLPLLPEAHGAQGEQIDMAMW
jgi:hypothetical protein